MRRPIVDIKPFTSSLISNCLVMSENNQAAPVSTHLILNRRRAIRGGTQNWNRTSGLLCVEQALSQLSYLGK